MNIPPVVWLVIGAVIFGGAMIAWSRYTHRRRRELIQAAAGELGLTFFATGDPGLVDELGCFELFSQGRHRQITNMIYGDAGNVKLGIFDYQYTTGHGKHKHTYRQTVASVNSPELALPSFVLRPEHLFHKIGSVLGFDDIDFESHPRFSSAYLLKGQNEEQIRASFSEKVLSYMENQTGISVEGNGPRLVYFRSRRMVAPADMRALMEEGFKLYGLFTGNA